MTAPDVAIIGMAGRFPGARDLDSLWSNLLERTTSVSFFSDEELVGAGVDPAVVADPSYVKAAPVLADVDMFDAAFFGYSPREATFIDPQQRVLLECAWEALDHAGYSAEEHDYPVGVFAGSSLNTYLLSTGLVDELDRDYVLTLSSSDKDFLATRIAYKLNLGGPAMTVQSACSTSLLAVHVACQSLLSGECDLALAGGVCVKVPQRAGYFWTAGGIVSRDGRVRPFDASASGTVFGSGAGVVVLKRLEDAVADRDAICAVVKGSAVNNDGSAKANFTAPSVDRQAAVIVEALARADIEPCSVTHVETHGTGTILGDPIELAALTKAWRSGPHEVSTCAIGSVKANIGHLEAASGVVGLIKAVLALEHETIPPLAEWEEPNPACDFDTSPFFVNARALPWPRGGEPRRAGVTSLGVGGTNVHVVLEEAPTVADSEHAEETRGWQILPLSARTATALAEMREQTADALRHDPGIRLADAAFTLQRGRRTFPLRDVVVCDTRKEAMRALACPPPPQPSRGNSRRADVVFAFPEAAAYAPAQIDELCVEPVFRRAFESFRADHKQAAQYAMASLWTWWGLRPAELVGTNGVCVAVAASLAADARVSECSTRDRLRELCDRDDVAVLVAGDSAVVEELLGERRTVRPVYAAFLADTRNGQSKQMLKALGLLWTAGVDVNWASIGGVGRRVRLPAHPFERQRFWWGDAR